MEGSLIVVNKVRPGDVVTFSSPDHPLTGEELRVETATPNVYWTRWTRGPGCGDLIDGQVLTVRGAGSLEKGLGSRHFDIPEFSISFEAIQEALVQVGVSFEALREILKVLDAQKCS